MSIEALKEQIPDFAKDVRLNVSSLVNDEALGEQTKWGLLLAVAIATRNPVVAAAFDADASSHLTPQARDAARAAVSIMAMNNVYYRGRHLIGKEAYDKKPARLRMNRIAKPASNKLDFELFCIAASAIKGCGDCLKSHEKVVIDGGLTEDHVHDTLRLAAVINGVAVALDA